MNIQLEQVSEEAILTANIEKYADDKVVSFYANQDELEYPYTEYTVIFNAVLDMLGREKPIKAVDMCGGAGRAAFILHECQPDCNITLVDCADKMLTVAQNKAKKLNIHNMEIVHQDAMSFLEQPEKFDLIIFSSAIHHFKDPVELLSLSAERLSPGGMIVTIADPSVLIKSTRYQILQFLMSNYDLKKRQIQKWIKGSKNRQVSEEFDIAEYQTITGIDDHDLKLKLQQKGIDTLMHLRYPAGGNFMIRILPLLGLSWAFSMVLAKPSDRNAVIKKSLMQEVQKTMPFSCKCF